MIGRWIASVPREGWLSVATLVLLSLALFGEPLVGDDVYFARDVSTYYWPTRREVARQWVQGHLPQWDATHQSGLPLLADIHSAVLYPPNALYQWVSFPRAYAWLMFLHQLSAALGMLAFLRRWTSWPAATAGAIAFAYSGYLASLVNAGPLLEGLSFVPWVLFAMTSTLRLRRRVVVLALLMTLQALSGDPQSVLFSVLLGSALLVFGAHRREQAIALFGGAALAGLLSGLQLLPAWELLRESTRASQADTRDAFTLHPARLFELIFPYLFGGWKSEPAFWAHFAVKGPGAVPFAVSAYAGAAAMALATLGIGSGQPARAAMTWVVGGLLLAIGHFGPLGILHHWPPFRFFRYPEKYLFMVDAGIAMLAALGIDRASAGNLRRTRVTLAIAGLFAVAVAVTLIAARMPMEEWVSTWPARFAREHSRAAVDSMAGALAWGGLFFLGALGLAAIGSSRLQRTLGWALVAVVAADIGITSPEIIWTGSRSLYETRPATADELGRHGGTPPYRIRRAPLDDLAPGGLLVEQQFRHRQWDLATLKSNTAGLWGLEETSGSGAVVLERWQRLNLALYPFPPILDHVFGACESLTWNDPKSPEMMLAGAIPRFEDANLRVSVYQFSKCTPRLSWARALEPADNLDETIAKIFSAYDHRLDPIPVVVEGFPERRNPQAGSIDGLIYDADHIRAHATAATGGGFLVLANTYYPGWSASIDGKPARLWITNAATMGIEVPAGAHDVEWSFRDPMLFAGAIASIIGAVIAIALWIARRAQTAPAAT